jgi:putative glutamine amidotransferase
VKGWRGAGVGVPAAYLEAVERAGGEAAVLPPMELDDPEAASRLERFDGLLLIGGGDLHPEHYGEEPGSQVYGVEPLRDSFELALARAAVAGEVPTLAICRGMQVLNVAAGGTLQQHLEGHGDPTAHTPITHDVTLEPGSRVAKAMAVDRAACSSHHHQAVGRVGDGLRAVAWSEDRAVEAVEHDRGWIVGVQWHPEDTCGLDPAQQGLFEELVDRARP